MNPGIKSGMELDWDGIWADVETAGIRARMASTSIYRIRNGLFYNVLTRVSL